MMVLPEQSLAVTTGDGFGKILIWKMSNWNLETVIDAHQNSILGLVLLNNDIICSSSYDKTFKIWRWKKKECLMSVQAHTQEIEIIVSFKANQLISAGRDHKIIIWE